MKKVITASVAVAVLTLACGGDEGVTPREPEHVKPTTPANVLKNVAISFNQRDINLLRAILSTDFVFYFDPRDVGQTPPGKTYIIPPSWSYTEFWQAVRNMFGEAYSIDLTVPTDGVGEPGPEETTYRADNVKPSLRVMVDENNGFLANHGYCIFEFERYDSASGKKFWRLTGWWDRTCGGYDEYPGVTPTSLGRILALFR